MLVKKRFNAFIAIVLAFVLSLTVFSMRVVTVSGEEGDVTEDVDDETSFASTIKYAVSIYGIQEDTYLDSRGNEQTSGLTFGPATSKSYASTYTAHLNESDYDPENGAFCLHWMSWEEIIEQAASDPSVFEDCLSKGCTHSVEIGLSDKLFSGNSYSLKGDGASMLLKTINSSYILFNDVYDVLNAAYWQESKIRATLNGADEYTNSEVAGSAVCDENECLLAGFPEELQEAIVPKINQTYTTRTETYAKAGDEYTLTYDKLWLFGVQETGVQITTNAKAYESHSYSKLEGNTSSSSSCSYRKAYNEAGSVASWRLRSVGNTYQSTKAYNMYVNSDGSVNTNGLAANNTGSSYGIVFGFSIAGPTNSIAGHVSFDDNTNQDNLRPESVSLDLKDENNKTVDTLTIDTQSGDKWDYEFADVPANSEDDSTGYHVEGQEEEGYKIEYEENEETGQFNIRYVQESFDTTCISGTITFDDNDNHDGFRPEMIYISLYGDDELIETKELTTTENTISYSFDDVYKNKEGKEIDYQVSITDSTGKPTTIDDYILSYSEEGYDITISHSDEVFDYLGTIIWDDEDDQDALRPETLDVYLYNGDNKAYEMTLDLSSLTDNTFIFSSVNKYSDHQEVEYTLKGDEVEDYNLDIDDSTLTYKHDVHTVSVEGTVTFDDNGDYNGFRPEIIYLAFYKEDQLEDTQKIDANEDRIDYSFGTFDKYSKGNEIVYNVMVSNDLGEAIEIKEYTIVYDDFDITLGHESMTMDINGTITWNDSNNQDGNRPDEVSITLYDGGDSIDEITVDASQEWSFIFQELNKYHSGAEIAYAIEAQEVDGYECDYDDDYNVTYSYEPKTTEIAGSFQFDDYENIDGNRPAAITIKLYANGVEVDSQDVSLDGDWSYSFNSLPKYSDGEEIVYTISVEPIEGYTSSADDDTIIIKPTTSVSGSITWNSDERPDEVTIKLIKDDEVIDSQTISASDNWSYHFDELEKYDDGNEFVYTIVVDEIDGYNFTVDGENITAEVVYDDDGTSLDLAVTGDDDSDDFDDKKTSLDGDEEPLAVEEEDNDAKISETNGAQTNDETNYTIYIVVGVIALIALIILIYQNHKSKKKS